MSIFSGHIEENWFTIQRKQLNFREHMNFESFRREIKSDVFDYQIFASYFKNIKKSRDKIASLVKQGKVIRIKKGLYIFGESWRNTPLCLETIANLIYGPSCVSFEHALTHYGLIAERSQVVTSLAIGDSKTFDTPIGRFEYRAISPEKFKIGIDYQDLGKEGGYFIASKEKALVDLVYRTAGIRSIEQLGHYLFEEMRVDETMFRALDFNALNEIANIYHKQSVKMMNQL